MSRTSHGKCLFLLVGALVLTSKVKADGLVRAMGVKAGPERVFTRPLSQIIPELKGATATHENGRVGAEFVFWGYKLDNGKTVDLFACTDHNDVNCQARIPLVCANGAGTLLTSITELGEILERKCDIIGKAGVGDLHPGCIDTEISNNLLVGLVSCPGS